MSCPTLADWVRWIQDEQPAGLPPTDPRYIAWEDTVDDLHRAAEYGDRSALAALRYLSAAAAVLADEAAA